MDIGIFDFAVLGFFRLVFLCQKTSVFRFWCSLQFADFPFFSIRFSVFVKNNSGFSVLLSNLVFGFGRIFWRFWMIFSSVLRFLIYPNVPLFAAFL